jgi:signal transduction histidine kinase
MRDTAMNHQRPGIPHTPFTDFPPLNLEEFFEKIIELCTHELKCAGGLAFVLNGGTHRLELAYPCQESKVLISLKPGEGIIGRAFNDKTFICCSESRSKEYAIVSQLTSCDRIRSIVALPVSEFGNPTTVLCLYFVESSTADHSTEKYHGLSMEEYEALQDFWKRFNSSKRGGHLEKFLYQLRMRQIQVQLRSVGDGPVGIREALITFVEKFKQEITNSLRLPPDFLYIQLIDHHERKIRTVKGEGMPLSYEYIHSHSLDDSDDIQSDIVKKRHIEIIVGDDVKRFDRDIFRKYGHDRFVRMWVPLFPLSFSTVQPGSDLLLNGIFSDFLVWNPEEVSSDQSMKRVIIQWRGGIKPPENLIYGTLEIGYFRKTMKQLDIAPWTQELAIWCITKAFELSQPLFRATLAGTLESIGQLLASGAYPNGIRVNCEYLDRNIRESRVYPTSEPWPAAVSEIIKNEMDMKMGLKKPDTPGYEYNPISVERLPLNDQEDLHPIFSSAHYLNTFKTNTKIAGDAFKIALLLFKRVLNPQELHVPEDDLAYIGTLRQDRVVTAVCKEAANRSNANLCYCIFFDTKPPPGQRSDSCGPWWVGIPASWPSESVNLSLWRELQNLARKVAENKKSHQLVLQEDSGLKFDVTLLPLELSDSTTGVLALRFSEGNHLSNKGLVDLESRVPTWVYRLSMRRLHLRARFSALMMLLRQDIAEARDETEAKINESNYIRAFIISFLKKSVSRQKSDFGFITLYSEQTTGPKRIERFLCSREPETGLLRAESYKFLNKSLSGPCLEACENHCPVIFSERKLNPKIDNFLTRLENEVDENERCGRRDKVSLLKKLLEILKNEQGNPMTMVTMPVLKREMGEDQLKIAYSVILNKKHYYDRVHRKLIIEFGEQIAETLDQVRSFAYNKLEERYQHCLFEVRAEFEKAKSVDDLVGVLLRKLAADKAGNQKPIGKNFERIGFSDEIVLWNLSIDKSELIMRSCRGQIYEAFESEPKIKIINPKEHPLFTKEEIALPKKNAARLIEGPFRLWTFSTGFESENQQSNGIVQFYEKATSRKWLTTFPIVDATDRVFGVIDFLRDRPVDLDEELVLERLFRRLSRQFCSAVERCHLKMTRSISRDIFTQSEIYLRLWRTGEVYKDLVHRFKDVFNTHYCDLFLEHYGHMLLHATTRDCDLASDKKRFKYRINQSCDSGEVLGDCFYSGKAKIQHRRIPRESLTHISPDVCNLLALGGNYERMALPLIERTKYEKIVVGILHLANPKRPIETQNKKAGKTVKKNPMFNAETIRLGYDLVEQIQRLIQMTRLVEQQGGLVNELVHSMGQPLQILRSAANNPIRALVQRDRVLAPEVKEMLNSINEAFKVVHEAKDHISFLQKFSQQHHSAYSFSQADLKKLVEDCCNFMAKRALNKNCRIVFSDVCFVKPLPLEKNWIRKAIINLLDNACKYSWSNREIMVKMGEGNNGDIKISISNWGVGIPLNQRQRIFEPYFRFKVPDAKGERTGTGIGLAIVKQAIEELHDGKIDFESRPCNEQNLALTDTVEDIIDIEHNTTFTISMRRDLLNEILNYKSEI